MRILKVLRALFFVLLLLFIAAQFKRPAKTNPPVDQSQTIEAHTQMTPQVAAILDRSCNDCHSNKTRWPWYSNVAPVSWLVVGHVDDARKDLNFSEWGKRDQDRQSRKLQQMCDEITDGAMPLGSYTPLHTGSKLSAADIKTLCDWTNSERQRLAAK
jgi:hypothetical protein